MVRGWRLAAVRAACVALAAVPGCGASQFECAQDSQCARDGMQGVCQEVGFCSFADESCASGQRFSDLAADLAGACVAPGEPEASSSAGGTTSTSTSTSTASTTGPSSGPTTDTPTTTDPVVDTTSGAGTTLDPRSSTGSTLGTGSDASSSGGESSGSTGEVSTTDEPPGCATPFVDEFNDATLGPGWQLFEEDLTVVEVMTELRFTMVADNESYATLLRDPLDVSGGYVRARITELPDAPTSQLIFDVRTGTDPAHEHRLVLEGHGALRIIDGGELQGEVDLPGGIVALDIQLGFETAGTVDYTYRVNNGAWNDLGSVAVDTELDAVGLRVIVGAWDPLTVPTEVIRLDTISGCFVDDSV